jgi:hypothetical protein
LRSRSINEWQRGSARPQLQKSTAWTFHGDDPLQPFREDSTSQNGNRPQQRNISTLLMTALGRKPE